MMGYNGNSSSNIGSRLVVATTTMAKATAVMATQREKRCCYAKFDTFFGKSREFRAHAYMSNARIPTRKKQMACAYGVLILVILPSTADEKTEITPLITKSESKYSINSF